MKENEGHLTNDNVTHLKGLSIEKMKENKYKVKSNVLFLFNTLISFYVFLFVIINIK